MSGGNIELVGDDGRRFGAYYAQPIVLPAPGVIVLQEILGVNEFLRSVVNRFAEKGYLALAPELYWRQGGNVQLNSDNEADMVRARELRDGFNEKLALEDCDVALNYLRELPACTGKVAVMGFCLGGKLAYSLASRSTLDAAIAYYGTGIHKALDEAEHLRAPLLLHIAKEDFLCSLDAQRQIHERLAALKNTLKNEATTYVYDGANHGFARKGTSHYDAAATALADSRTEQFLNTYLK